MTGQEFGHDYLIGIVLTATFFAGAWNELRREGVAGPSGLIVIGGATFLWPLFWLVVLYGKTFGR